jgi:hypothetical protein
MNHSASMYCPPNDPNDDQDLRDALIKLADDGNPHGDSTDDQEPRTTITLETITFPIPLTLGGDDEQQPNHQHA